MTLAARNDLMGLARSSADERIRAFLAGDSDGADVLHAIYDHVLDEPLPERLRVLSRR